MEAGRKEEAERMWKKSKGQKGKQWEKLGSYNL